MDYYPNNPSPHPTGGWAVQPYPAAAVDWGLRSFMLKVFNRMTGGLAVTGVVAYAAAETGFYTHIAGTPLVWLVMFAPFALALFLGFRVSRMSPGAAHAAFWAYAALMGLSLAGIFLAYTGDSIARVFFITAGTFAATAAWGYSTRTDLTRFGSFLIMGLIGVIIASVVNLFIGSSAIQFAVSVIGILVFTGLTAWDTQRLKTMYLEAGYPQGGSAGNLAILGALTLYLDFVNLFISLLQLVGVRRD
ncbi:MAG TPA: Bax inhibitor-1/YccA family protein [Rhodopila sp.]|uniref:Bax inhibitor-1/YccA family protein n=1 Tax=Rhodopila sp. TaxID=2480087 RepID=UPI002B524777|nr:Bax inhibitor-1/YccA family protein [Rhodopila sp.]HVY14369.1 Bax inhibitor-1/YccA family protein [Rhodopila sp.]